MKDHAIYGNRHTVPARTKAGGIRCDRNGDLSMNLGPSKLFNYLITLILVGLAVWAAGFPLLAMHGTSLDQRWPGPSCRRS
jgi:hypothetical protein